MNPSAIVDEYLDHEKRKRNLIVYNFEGPSVQSVAERSKLNWEKIAHHFQTEFHIWFSTCIRLWQAISSQS